MSDLGALALELNKFKEYLGEDVKWDDKTRGMNILQIEAPPEKWPILMKLIDVLDVPEPQVFVEARIIEIKYDSNLEFGVEAMYDRRVATDAAQPFFGKFVGNFNPANIVVKFEFNRNLIVAVHEFCVFHAEPNIGPHLFQWGRL